MPHRTYALLLALLLVGCGKELRISGFESYVSRFERASEAAGHATTVGALIIEFDKSRTVDLGQCETGNFFATPHIRVNQARWEYLNDTQREELLFHELGHCILGRTHVTDRLPNGQPISMMFPNILDTWTYQDNRDYYLRELFEGK